MGSGNDDRYDWELDTARAEQAADVGTIRLVLFGGGGVSAAVWTAEAIDRA